MGGGRVGLRERADGGGDAAFLRRGEDHGRAGFEAGFGHGVADAGGAADDEHARVGELGGVFG